MGLGGVKNKRKIGDDPNNTKWARNTNAFGHKMLRAHGWEPGQYLGRKSEAYSAFHTAASASYIRAVLREDNLGIGAKPANGGSGDQCTGLDGFKDLLGRLNGTSEAVIEKKQQARESVKMTLYVERKFGPMRFVRGGLLVGDSMQEEENGSQQTASTAHSNEATDSTPESSSNDDESAKRKAKKDKKRKEKEEKKKEKREKKEASKKRKAARDDDELEDGSEERSAKKSRREKRDENEVTADEEKSTKDRKKKKKDKKDKKDKDEKKRRKEAALTGDSSTETKRDKLATSDSLAATAPLPVVLGRHMSRRRHIAQKRAAVMDPQALKQVWLCSTPLDSNIKVNNTADFYDQDIELDFEDCIDVKTTLDARDAAFV
ncbi:g-patch domain containing protein [Grosmannia clavigera kw1407]|uniref:PinX1-related protein 1 n=1 Tax=Grosmannia clavigera (strain kw1407 / UAMH 11150) TaxID=655863 RepID=F0XE47_GROCL|nr:g-patch domain containing protein [Grosmannia clavigera kw1407]EFX04415.1 g-patch domain containing protein [Grosmannia clavigera kw1407]